MIKLDYSQHQCPYPVIETRKQILANPGVVLEVRVGDEAGKDNVSRLAQKMGYQASANQRGASFILTLTPKNGVINQTSSSVSPTTAPASGASVVYCGSDRMGDGDDGFGRVLIKNFLMTLLEMDPPPSHILFVNSGINLTTEEGETLEALIKLNERGVDLASCGLCLDFYHRKEQLKIGRVTNMYEIVELQNQAARVIVP